MTTRRIFAGTALAAALGLFATGDTEARKRRRRRTKREIVRDRIRNNRARCGSQWRRNSQVPYFGIGGGSYCFDKRDADLFYYPYTDENGLTHTTVGLYIPTCEGGVTLTLTDGDDMYVTRNRYCVTIR